MRVLSLKATLVLFCGAAGIACGPPPSPDAADITLVSYEAGPNGTVVSRTQAITYHQYGAMHAGRSRGRASTRGNVAPSQSALGSLGDGSGPGALPPACGDDRTTWIYNVDNGWA